MGWMLDLSFSLRIAIFITQIPYSNCLNNMLNIVLNAVIALYTVFFLASYPNGMVKILKQNNYAFYIVYLIFNDCFLDALFLKKLAHFP